MGNNLFTNTLLVVIAALLLVLVIQNGLYHPSNYERPMIAPQGMSDMAPDRMPPERAPAQAPGAPAGMEHSMVYAAVKAFPKGCEGKTLLADCDSPDALVVKNKIEAFAQNAQGPRQIFDFIVSTWGEKVLTDQALQIRKMRKK